MTDYSQLRVDQRVDRMRRDAMTRFGCVVTINQSMRTAEQAQAFHVCHMFLHNYFPHLRPKNKALDGRTIAWEYLSNARLKWALIASPEQMFLRTRENAPARRQLIGAHPDWVPGYRPDKHATVQRMAKFLSDAHVKSMAAPGIDGCGEPCGCGGHASKHVSGRACDVSGLDTLGQHLVRTGEGFKSPEDAIDHFLAEHQLFRPLAHLPGKSRETWHLEALPPHHSHGIRRHHHSRHTHAHHIPEVHDALARARLSTHHGC